VGVVGPGVLEGDAERAELGLEGSDPVSVRSGEEEVAEFLERVAKVRRARGKHGLGLDADDAIDASAAALVLAAPAGEDDLVRCLDVRLGHVGLLSEESVVTGRCA
jgi:L-alanine-DL-glutamate epimerase-like enolase superfamily enzyme